MAEQLEGDEKKDSSPILGTDCAECVFFDKDKNCHLGKLEKFFSLGAIKQEEEGKFLINRICNFRRTKDWQGEKDISQCEKTVSEEVQIVGSVVVFTSDMHELDECLQNLSNTKYIENFKVIISHFEDISMNQVFQYLKEQTHIKNCVAVGIKEDMESDDQINFLDEAFKRAKNGFIVTIDSAQKFDLNILEKLHKFIYEEMNRLLYVPPSDGIHECVVQAMIYKYLRGNKFWTFEEKIKEFTEHHNLKSQITSWNQINSVNEKGITI